MFYCLEGNIVFEGQGSPRPSETVEHVGGRIKAQSSNYKVLNFTLDEGEE